MRILRIEYAYHHPRQSGDSRGFLTRVWVADTCPHSPITNPLKQKVMRQIAILIMGEYDCYDAYIRHENESHSAEEWRDIYRNENCYAEIWRFDTPEELASFLKGVEAVDSYVSSDYYTAYVQTERITSD